MAIAIRDLQRNTSGVVADVIKSGRPLVVTKNGEPAVALLPIEELEDLVLALPEVAGDLADADRQVKAGETVSYEDLFAD